jgi:N utilization substance protein B
MVGERRKARTLALQALYEVDTTGHQEGEVITRLLTEASLSEENMVFARDLVGGVIESKERIDLTIKKFAIAWPIRQMPVIDRNVLRLAIFEILIDNKVPVKAAINEAVELAKIFGSDNSARFVNGVLGSVSNMVDRS